MRYGDGMRGLIAAMAGAAGGAILCWALAGAAEVEPGSAAHGRKIYVEKGCARCHAAAIAEEEGATAPIRPGHPLEGAAWRGTWWNGRITTDAAEASDYCRRTFVDAEEQSEFTTAERKALVVFMQELGDERGISPLTLLRRDAGDVDPGSGDPARGEDLYRRACAACHGGGDAVKVETEARTLARPYSPIQIADIVRRGKGRMPFFQVDRLTAPQVADIAAWMESLKKPADAPHP